MDAVDILVNILVPIALFVVMMVIGMDLSTDDFRRVANYPKPIVIGTLAQLIGLPLLAAGIIGVLPLSPEDIGALIIFSACPGGGLSNVMTAQAKGNVALSVSYTAIGSMLGLVTIPIVASLGFALLLDESASISVPALPMFAQLLVLVVIPISLGMWFKSHYTDFTRRHEQRFNRISAVLIVIILSMSLLVDNSITAESFKNSLPAAIMFSIASVIIGLTVAKLSGMTQADQRALLIEFSVRHAGIAALIVIVILERFDLMSLLTACTLTQLITVLAVVAVLRISDKRASRSVTLPTGDL